MNHNLIGAVVHTHDSQDAGRVGRVAMDPAERKITHLIVHRGLVMGRDIVVPIAHMNLIDDGHLHLDLDTEALLKLPDFQETDFMPPEEGWEYPLAYPPGGVVWPMSMTWAGASTYPVLSNTIVKENIPEADVTIDTDTHVECVDGHCGKVDRVLVDDDTQAVVGFVIRKGFIFTRDIQASMDWVQCVDDEGVHLNLTIAELEEKQR